MREITSGDPDVELSEGSGFTVKSAGGLLIWASTAVKLVSMSGNPFRKLRNLVSDWLSVSRFDCDEFYATVLRGSGISWNDNDSKARFSAVLALLPCSKNPPSKKDTDAFLGLPPPPDEPSHLILSRMRCLLSYTPGEPVRLFHASFYDYSD